LTIEGRWDEIDEIHKEIFGEPQEHPVTEAKVMKPVDLEGEELLTRARNAANGLLFRVLYDDGDTSSYPSHSEADLALCSLLAFRTGNDAERIDRLFRQSGLMREKWDKRHHSNGNSYGRETIRRAIEANRETYQGPRDRTESKTHEPEGPKEVSLLGFNLTDAGNAEAFQAMWGERFVFLSERKVWLQWNRIRWMETDQALLKMVETVRERGRQAWTVDDLERRKAIAKASISSESRFKLNAALSIAETMMRQNLTAFDVDPMTLPVQLTFGF
jgi:hypothetical protein